MGFYFFGNCPLLISRRACCAISGSDARRPRGREGAVPCPFCRGCAESDSDEEGEPLCLQLPRGCSFVFPPQRSCKLIFPRGARVERIQSMHSIAALPRILPTPSACQTARLRPRISFHWRCRLDSVNQKPSWLFPADNTFSPAFLLSPQGVGASRTSVCCSWMSP